MIASSERVLVVPGSTSNLGAGFDSLAVALTIYLRVEVQELRPERPGACQFVFGDDLPSGENRIETAFRRACEVFGEPATSPVVRVSSEIPMGAGLGSSAAATIAGLRLFELASRRTLAPEDLLSLAAEIEGHPDNVSASLLGGFTLSCRLDTGGLVARSWPWPADVAFVVATPQSALATTTSRRVVPDRVSLRDAVANLQRALLLVRALQSGRYSDIREAVKDRWHQPARAALVPGLKEVLDLEDPSILGVCLSGAGPSIVALAAPERSAEAAAVLEAFYRRLGLPHRLRTLRAHPCMEATVGTTTGLKEHA